MDILAQVKRIGPGSQFFTFCVFGAANTLVHAGAVIAQVEVLQFNQIAANTVAFFLANIFSYIMNASFTFHHALSINGYYKFLSSSLATLAITLGISTLGELFSLHYLLTTGILIVVGPIITFTLLKKFAFRS